MPIQKVRSFTFHSDTSGNGPLVLSFKEANSQSFVEGDLVVLNAAGDISLATAGVANQILGIARKAATNVTSGNIFIPVEVIRPYDVWECNYASGTTFAASQLGENHQIVRTGAGNWEVASGTAATDVRVKVVGTLEGIDGVGHAAGGAYTSGGPILVRFLIADDANQVLQFATDAAV